MVSNSTLFRLKEIESTEYYPLIYIPNRVIQKINGFDNYDFNKEEINEKLKEIGKLTYLRTCPVKPNKPKEPTTYYIKQKTKRDWTFKKIIEEFLLGSVSLVGLVCILVDISIDGLIMFLLPGLGFIFYLPESYKINKHYDYTEKEQLYNQKLYEVNLEIYNKSLELYNLNFKTYEQERIELNINQTYVKEQILKKKYLSGLHCHNNPSRSKELIKKGKTENLLLEHLIKHFSKAVMINMAFETYNSAFYPDFCYHDEEYGFYIDIEIDEKFSKENGNPIHYIGSEDEIRNKFFIDKDWFVLRFAEAQVEEDPDLCCKFLEKIIHFIKNPYSPDQIINFPISKIKRWTYEEIYLDKSQ
jgi:hypothetical protein